MAFLVVTGAPCSGKSTFIASHASPGEPIFQRGGVRNDPERIVADRKAFIERNRGAPVAWIEAVRLTPTLRRQLFCSSWREIRMQADEATCLARLMASDREDKDEFRRIIASHFLRG